MDKYEIFSLPGLEQRSTMRKDFLANQASASQQQQSMPDIRPITPLAPRLKKAGLMSFPKGRIFLRQLWKQIPKGSPGVPVCIYPVILFVS